MFSILYGDRAGHVMYVFNGAVPVRPAGELDWSRVVPGSSSTTLWTRIHPYAELPKVLDPPSGWVQNANDPPWTATLPPVLRRAAFPPYMAPSGLGFRAQHALRVLSDGAGFSLDQLIAAKQSTRMELADRILDDLIAAARKAGGDRLAAAATVLEHWDRTADAESRGSVLFMRFVLNWFGNGTSFGVPWDESHPIDTPTHLASAPTAAAALDKAAEWVTATYGALDVRWGDVFRLRRDGVDLPSSGIVGDPFGSVRVVGYTPAKDGKFEASLGDSYVAAVEFSQPVRAQVLLGYGNASQPGSPHRTDQLSLFAEKKLRTAWRARDQILAHLSDRDIF
jgi:acyl-homoserine-lactone acylase